MELDDITCPRCGSENIKKATPHEIGWWMDGDYYPSRRTVCVECDYEFGLETEIVWEKEGMDEEEFKKFKEELVKKEANEESVKEFTSVYISIFILIILVVARVISNLHFYLGFSPSLSLEGPIIPVIVIVVGVSAIIFFEKFVVSSIES